MSTLPKVTPTYTATQNACKLCAPLGASLVFKGIRGAVPLLHGSQGCSTYIRRYMISHFKEPMDIACSNFGEQTAIFGGGANIKIALENIRLQYDPELIGIATTCLAETIGDDVPMFLHEYRRMCAEAEKLPPMVHVSTPSYSGTHMDGFHGAVRATVEALAQGPEAGGPGDHVNLFSGMISPADIRYLKSVMKDFDLPTTLFPDYSRTMDGGLWTEYQRIPEGGTPVEDLKRTGAARASVELGHVLARAKTTAGTVLSDRFGVPCHRLGLPMGVEETDRFFAALSEISGRPIPEEHLEERGRLLDAYADGHKYVSGVRAVVYGEEDLVAGLATFLSEIGIIPVLCASGGRSGKLKPVLSETIPDMDKHGVVVKDGVDFVDIETIAQELKPNLLIGASKGYSMARRLELPLVRVGFPIHDRFGGTRLHHLGYRGAQELLDRIANTLVERNQGNSDWGYTYM
ncbi:MAG: nitrogenase component 1 [Desulfococcaceae bacterium]